MYLCILPQFDSKRFSRIIEECCSCDVVLNLWPQQGRGGGNWPKEKLAREVPYSEARIVRARQSPLLTYVSAGECAILRKMNRLIPRVRARTDRVIVLQ